MIRAALFACAACCTLAFAGPALASYSPKLIVSGGGGPATVEVKVAAADAPTARVVIYVPLGYRVGSPQVGTTLGKVRATAAAADLNGAVLTLVGDLRVVDPATFTAVQKQTEQLCLDGSTASQVWDMHVSAVGQVLDIPLYVIAASPTEKAFAGTKLEVCLPPPDVPVGTPGRSTFGAKLLSASFTSSAIAGPASAGEYRWRTLWTPYVPLKGTPNLAGSVEAQALVRSPARITQKAVAQRRQAGRVTVTVAGKVTEHGVPVTGARVAVYTGGTKSKLHRLKTVTTNAKGVYVARVVVKRPQWFRSVVGVPLRDLHATGCTPTFPPARCIDATVGAYRLTSAFARVRG
ncbi:MAG: hypothetical protein ACRDM1_12300 [Gaiellaceae bacterium]